MEGVKGMKGLAGRAVLALTAGLLATECRTAAGRARTDRYIISVRPVATGMGYGHR